MKQPNFKLLRNLVLLIFFFGYYCSFGQNQFLWPLPKEIGIIVLKPGNTLNPITNEPIFNSGYFINAPFGTPVYAVEDGVISFVSKYEIIAPNLKWMSSFNSLEGFQEKLKTYGENNTWFREEYLMGGIGLKLSDGSTVYYSGLIRGDSTHITGNRVKRGDTIGFVGFFRVISKTPCIQISLSNPKGTPGDIGIPLLNENNKFENLINQTTHKEILTASELKYAFKIFKESLEEGHPSLYVNTPKYNFDTLFSQIENKLNSPMNLQSFCTLLMPIIAKIGCSHTYLSYNKTINEDYYFPLWLSFIEGRCIVIGDKSGKNLLQKGCEILAIDGKPINEVIDLMKTFMFNDVQTDEWKEQQLLKPNWFQYYFKFVNNGVVKSSYNFKIINPDQKLQEITLSSITKKTYPEKPIIPKLIQEQEEILKFKRITSEIAYLSIQTCDFYESLKNEIELMVDTVINENYKNLIIDLRFNLGGNDISFLSKLFINQKIENRAIRMVKSNAEYSLLKYSLNYSNNMFLFPDYLKIEGKDGFWKETNPNSAETPSNNSFYKGKIYVLTGSGQQSYAVVLANLLYEAGAIIVGEETGGGYYSMNAETSAKVKLGETDLVLTIPLVRIILNTTLDARIPPNRGLIPHYKISKTIKSVLEDEDNQLDFCIQLISNN
jgi:hypothetical protein